MKPITTILLSMSALLSLGAWAQKHNPIHYNVNRIEMHRKMNHDNVRQRVNLPQIDGYKTLKCDFHTHSVFSDGDVWPTVRVREAWQDGLDVIALTEHTSERPSKKQLSGGPNTSYEIAKPEADMLGIILAQATEISRSKENGGHLNAIFITDAVPTLNKNTTEAVRAAAAQGAFIIWNHPGWDIGSCKMFEVNENLIKEGKIHAIEVFNEAEWYPRALNWTGTYNLAPVATSDIHGQVHGQYQNGLGKNRPMTLAFASGRDEQALKEALFARRTLAYFDNSLAGSEELLTKFFKASLDITKVVSGEKNRYLVTNNTDVPYELTTEEGYDVIFPANGAVILEAPKEQRALKANVRNLHTDEFKTLDVSLDLPL